MGFILDSSVLIATERKRFALDAFFTAHIHQRMCIAAITVSELLHGVERANASERRNFRSALMEKFITDLDILDFDTIVARRHAVLWARLKTGGTLIGLHDMQIAATALAYDYSLATLNQAEFRRVPDLRLIDIAPFAA